MTETPMCRKARSRRQVLQTLVALAVVPPAALAGGYRVHAQRRTRKERPKFRLVTRRFSIPGASAGSGSGLFTVLAEAVHLPLGTVAAISVKLSAITAPNAGYVDALLGSGVAGADRFSFPYGTLISDAGNGGPANGVPVTIASRAKKAPSRTGRLVAGTYRATNFDGGDAERLFVERVSLKSLLGKPARQDWYFGLVNDGPGGTSVSTGAVILTLTVKVRR